MKWTVTGKEWEGLDAYILGGGASLRDFDFNLLQGLPVIGCNESFRLGPHIAPVCVFGDGSWFERTKHDLERFGGVLVSVVVDFPYNVPWVRTMQRVSKGWGEGSKLGWWFTSGSSAVNLAANLGAKRIFLLGFDSKAHLPGRTHWHDNYTAATEKKRFDRHFKGFQMLSGELVTKPVEVFNAVNGDSSALTMFPAVDLDTLIRSLPNPRQGFSPLDAIAVGNKQQPCLGQPKGD